MPSPHPSRPTLSLTRAAAGVAALLVTLVVVAIAALALAADESNTASARATHGERTQGAIDDTLESILDVETGLRAYLLTGDPAVLQPFHMGQRTFAQATPALLAAMRADAHLVRAQQAVVAGRRYIVEYARPTVARRNRGVIAAPAAARLIGEGRRRVDRLRAMLGGLESGEHAETTRLIAGAAYAADRDRTIGIAALAAALVLLVLVGVLLRRGVLVPLRNLRHATERLSTGDLSTRVGAAPSREFAPINAALDTMAGRFAERRQELVSDLEEARLEVLHRLARATEYRDDDTHEHTERVACTAALLAQTMGLPDDDVGTLRLAATLHDVGKVGISDAILLKPGRLTPEEFAEMQRHTTFGAEMLAGSPSPVLQMAERIALGHHERWDGCGYPLGLVGPATPLPARIVAVADVFDALTHERPYKEAWPVERARAEIEACAGTQFDPDVVAAFLSLPRPELERAATAPLTLSGPVAGPALAQEALELASDHVA
jgi:putative two-component system response regulator